MPAKKSCYFDMLLAFLDSAVTERFVKDVHRSMLIAEKHSEQLLDRFESYVSPKLDKWLDRANR
jgi:predicted Rossmann-fold nucleotide-binding protein